MKILILGGNGMIGHKMYQVLSQSFSDVWVVLRQPLKTLPYKQIFGSNRVIDSTDLTDFNKLAILLDEHRPDIIINAAGITIRRGVNDKISYSIVLNAALPHFLAEWVSGKNGKRLIHFSTDCVFSGRSGFYAEESPTDAKDYYGQTKALGEVQGPQVLTIRGSMIGRELANNTELLEWFLAQHNGPVKGYCNAIYSGITTVRMAAFVKKIITEFPLLSGIYNVSSLPISKYELLVKFKEVFGLDTEILKDMDYVSKKNMVADKFFKETGLTIPNWDELAAELRDDAILNKNYYKK